MVTRLDAQNVPGQLLGGGASNLRHNFINVAHDQDVNEIVVRLLVGHALAGVHASYLTDLRRAPITRRRRRRTMKPCASIAPASASTESVPLTDDPRQWIVSYGVSLKIANNSGNTYAPLVLCSLQKI